MRNFAISRLRRGRARPHTAPPCLPPEPACTAPSSPFPAATCACSRRRPPLGADVVMLDLEDAVAPDDKERAREQVIARAARARLVALLGLAAHQRARHALVLPRRRRRDRAGRRPRRHGADPEGRLRGRRPPRRDAARRRSRRRTGCPHDRHQRADRDRARACTTSTRSPPPARSGWRRWCSASPTTPPRCRATRPRSAAPPPPTPSAPTPAPSTGATSGTTRSRASRSPAARTACGRSTARTATSATPRATAPPRAAPPCSATRASGRSTRRRSRSPTTSSRPTTAAAEKTRRIIAAMAEAAREGRGAVCSTAA